MAKSRDAFRTISEVSEALDTPAHVLRFWESKFKQIKPVKRAGGRRYYRPDDLALLAAIKDLLHGEGYSIKDAQKIIREAGVKATVAQGHIILGFESDEDVIDAPVVAPRPAPSAPAAQADLFAGTDVSDNTPPRIEIVSATAVSDTAPMPEPELAEAAPEQKSTAPAPIILPDEPAPRDDVQPRILATLMEADPAILKKNAAQIAPLIAKLESLRDELRHQW